MIDIVLVPIYLFFIYVIFFLVRKNFFRTKEDSRVFVIGLSLKIVGAISLALIFKYYYGYGDILRFHDGCGLIYNTFWKNPVTGLKLILYSPSMYDEGLLNVFYSVPDFYANRIFYIQSTRIVVQLAALLNLLSFNSLIILNILLATLSSLASWMLFVALRKIVNFSGHKLALAIFYWPSVFFWSSGLLKDTFAFIGICVIIYYFLEIFKWGKVTPLSIILIVLNTYITYSVKPYVVLILIPSLALFFVFSFLNNSRINLVTKTLFVPAILFISVSIALIFFNTLSASLPRYSSVDEILRFAEITHGQMIYSTSQAGGSGYTLGAIDYTVSGIISKAPISILTTLYRPFIFEVTNILTLISAVENLFLIIFSAIVIVTVGPVRILTTISNHPFLLSLFVFVIIFSFVIGFMSYNFGALVRYKIPCIPFFLIILQYCFLNRKSKRYHTA